MIFYIKLQFYIINLAPTFVWNVAKVKLGDLVEFGLGQMRLD